MYNFLMAFLRFIHGVHLTGTCHVIWKHNHDIKTAKRQKKITTNNGTSFNSNA